ncbi:MAG TPA: PQQ-binding-like beta-propeller repeat protein [Pirellulales bacterium]|nr:PQQ-binding-like beta-propeller repeat protein [Pirellulales bacterium]
MRSTLTRVLFLLAALAINSSARADDEWPQFRGPDGQGHATAHDLPTQWSETQNIAWKTPIPGLGHSSPLVGRGLVWLTTALEDGRSLQVVAVDAASGQVVRQREVLRIDSPPHLNKKNSPASPTGVLEGDRLYVHFGTSGTALLSTADASTLWVNQELHLNHSEGPGSSPVIWNNLLIVHCDGIDVQYIVALDKNTGKIVWRVERTGDKAADGNENKAFCTPLVIEVDGRPLLISPAARRVFAYDPATGKEVWVVHYAPGYSNVPRPVFGHGLFFISTGYDHPELWAIRPDGTGDVTASHVVWKVTENAPTNPSPLLVGDELYMMSDSGIATCLDAKTGTRHWRKRIGENQSASPLLADGKIYFWSEEGQTVVLAPGTSYNEIARNRLDDGFMSTPAAVGTALFARTRTHLYRIETAKTAAAETPEAKTQ